MQVVDRSAHTTAPRFYAEALSAEVRSEQMEVLLELGESRRIIHLESMPNIELIHKEIEKFGDPEINSCLSLPPAERGKVFRLQKWSQKWECYVDVDSSEMSLSLKDGDRITVTKKRNSAVKVSEIMLRIEGNKCTK